MFSLAATLERTYHEGDAPIVVRMLITVTGNWIVTTPSPRSFGIDRASSVLDVDCRWWTRVRDDPSLLGLVRRWLRGGVLVMSSDSELRARQTDRRGERDETRNGSSTIDGNAWDCTSAPIST